MPHESALSTVDDLRTVYRPPAQRSLDKQLDHVDEHCRDFIAHVPFVVLATSGPDGSCDVSPKGGKAGFVAVLDEHRLAIPDLSGNNRLDSLTNLVANSGIGLLFLIPGVDETLRVNGRARLVTEPDVLDACAAAGPRPIVAIVVDVDEAFIHCAKALRRAGIWQHEAWPQTDDMATPACMLRDHVGLTDVSAEDTARYLEDNLKATLWEVGGSGAGAAPLPEVEAERRP